MQISMPRMGFEARVLVFERAKTFRALDHAATMIGTSYIQVSETNRYATLYALLHTYIHTYIHRNMCFEMSR
jgi:hypothetical protein